MGSPAAGLAATLAAALAADLFGPGFAALGAALAAGLAGFQPLWQVFWLRNVTREIQYSALDAKNMKNTAMHNCSYLVQPTNTQEKLNIELFCKFGRVKVTVPSPPCLLGLLGLLGPECARVLLSPQLPRLGSTVWRPPSEYRDMPSGCF